MDASQVCQAMVQFAHQFKELRNNNRLSVDSFTSGIPFAIILSASKQIDIELDDLDQLCLKWINRVSNLKKIISKMRSFFQKKIMSTDKLDDIDVVQIAKHGSQQHLSKFFGVVMTVLLISPMKEQFIEMIMRLDGGVQKTFVQIIKSSNHEITEVVPQNSTIIELQQELKELRRENADLKSNINQLGRKNKHLQRQLKDLRDKLINYEQQLELKKTTDHSLASDDLQFQFDKQKILLDNLKIKLLANVRESEMQISKLKEQISNLVIRCQGMQELQSNLYQYKQLYNQAVSELQKLNDVQKEKRKLMKVIEDKDEFIRKLQSRFEGYHERLESKSEEAFLVKMESEKKEVKQKTAQKEIKRLKSEPAQMVWRYGESNLIEDQRDEINYLQEQLSRMKMRVREYEREQLKNRKKFEKMGEMQRQKKRMQRVVEQVNRSKDVEIELLVVSLNELREQNIKIFEMLKHCNIFRKDVK